MLRIVVTVLCSLFFTDSFSIHLLSTDCIYSYHSRHLLEIKASDNRHSVSWWRKTVHKMHDEYSAEKQESGAECAVCVHRFRRQRLLSMFLCCPAQATFCNLCFTDEVELKGGDSFFSVTQVEKNNKRSLPLAAR